MRCRLKRKLPVFSEDPITGKMKKSIMPKGIEGKVIAKTETHYYDQNNKLMIIVGYQIEWDWFGAGRHDSSYHESMIDILDEGINKKDRMINQTGRIRK